MVLYENRECADTKVESMLIDCRTPIEAQGYSVLGRLSDPE